ncbi:ammonium transporter [Aestuariivirga sp.]|uniref:ammonium transporter n=1 Tax=Aestuariivirga sp. TaxID=2650926 RepID=UPI003BAA4076
MDFKQCLRRPALAATAGLGLSILSATSAGAAATVNKGDTTWMLVATCFVVLMTVPGLALFYGGLVRAKNVLSVLMQVLVVFSIISILWVLYGYSLAFTGNASASLNPFIGGFSKLFLAGVTPASEIGTFSKETNIPELAFVIFQMTFACITPALIVGAYAERMKFSAVLLFMVIWFTFAYLPMAHMVWFWAGPDAYTLSADNLSLIASIVGEDKANQLLAALGAATTDDAKAAVLGEYASLVNATNGYLFNLGALDFAGGTVVHINAGVAGLVCAIVLGKRVGLGRDPMAPHNLTFVLTGAGLLLFGWYGFNAGSSLEANGLTALIILNSTIAAGAAALAWMGGEWMFRGHPSLLGGASGLVAGLVAITPACGFVGPGAAILIGLAAGFLCLWAVVVLKSKLGYDDALDVFGVHGIGGILGALLTGVFVNPALGGSGVTDYLAAGATVATAAYSFSGQMYAQFMAVIIAIVWTAIVSVVALMICKAVFGLRVKEQEEREGLDVVDHGERAYN